MTEAEEAEHLALLEAEDLAFDFDRFAREHLKIKPKLPGPVVPLVLNRAQRHVRDRLDDQKRRTGKVRALLLKARQQGFSTYIGGRYYHLASHNDGLNVFILTHEDDATTNLFGMVERYHEHNTSPTRPVTSADNAKELIFPGLDSGYSVGTAGAKARGRSKTIHLFHGCLSPKSLIVDGISSKLRSMDSFVLGEFVRTHTGVRAPISFISEQAKPVSRLVLKGLRDFPLTATNEHRFWTPDGWRELSELNVGDRVGYPVATISEESIVWPFRLPDAVRAQGGGTRETGPDSVGPSYDLGRVLGLYLAEGCIAKQSKGREPSAVSFAVHEREVARTLEWLEPLSGLYRSVKVAPRADSKTVVVTAYGRSFATFVRERCGELDDKALPAEWATGGDEFARGLVHGYLAGDGHSSSRPGDRRIRATSVRSAITVGMRDALASLGYGWAGIEHKDAGRRAGRNEREAWTLALCGNGVDRLVAELGWQMPPRKRTGNYGETEVSSGYAWPAIVAIEDAGEQPVMDFEIDHPDHSYCAVQSATHNSEVAFWPNAATHFAGVVQAIPDLPGTEIVLESTANGVGGEFHERWQQAEAGIGDYEAIFVPWFWSDEYRREVPEGFVLDEEESEYFETYRSDGLTDLEQMVWRRAKIAELKDPQMFKQEYPATAAEAFQTTGHDSFIKPQAVMSARKANLTPIGALVIGVDPKREGKDRFAIAWRQGRKVLKVESDAEPIDTLRAATKIKDIIDTDKPKRVFIDAGGGGGIHDVLHSWGAPYDKIVKLISFGSSPIHPPKIDKDGKEIAGYLNRRAEMWGLSRDWLEEEGGADIPDKDSLQADACGPGYHYHPVNSKLVLESKEHMRLVRKIRSPDEWDAIALTFAEPVKDEPQRPVSRPRAAPPTRNAWMKQ